jgi:SAM-dependent methyltransferase
VVDGLTRWAGRRFIYRAPDEQEQCPACGSRRLAVLGVHRLQRSIAGRRTGLVSGCEACGLVFVNPPPSDEDLAARYAPTGEWARERPEDAAPALLVDKKPGSGSWPELFAAVRDDIDVTRPPAGARALDFGCGRGKFLDVLQACGWETFGIEPASDAAFARHQRLSDVPAAPAFDLIVVHHVLEHVVDPLALLRQFAAAARPGALLLIAVPRLDTLPVHGDYGYVISRVHVTAYTAACLTGLLARAGWATVAAPQDEVRVAGGRRTTARLRMLARKAAQDVPRPVRPLAPARTALRTYHRRPAARTAIGPGPMVRPFARGIEARRWLERRFGGRLAQLRGL